MGAYSMSLSESVCVCMRERGEGGRERESLEDYTRKRCLAWMSEPNFFPLRTIEGALLCKVSERNLIFITYHQQFSERFLLSLSALKPRSS